MLMLELLDKALRNRGDLTRRAARRDDHVIRHLGLTAQVDLHDVFGLVVFQRCQDVFEQLLARQGGVLGHGLADLPCGLITDRVAEVRQDIVLLFSAPFLQPGAGLNLNLASQYGNSKNTLSLVVAFKENPDTCVSVIRHRALDRD